MFRNVGRKLAIFNTLIVVGLIIVIGLLTYATLRRNLQREVDRALEDRIASVSSPLLPDGGDSSVRVALDDDDDEEDHDEDDDDDDDEHREDREIVSSGDTVLLLTDRDGQITENPRDINLADIPVREGVDQALAGKIDVRSVELSDDTHMRVMTVPLVDDGQIVGTVQALRSLDEHEEQLEIVRNMTLLGVGLGLVVAGPVGYFLSRRAMVPINTAFDRQRTFVADASHELRTPLTLIRANAEFAGRHPERKVQEIEPSLQRIVGEVDRVSAMVTDLLTIARLDAGRLELACASSDLGEIARAAVESMQPVAEEAGVSLVASVDGQIEAIVDAPRIEQVIRIVLDNAIRHTPSGGEVVVEAVAEDRWREIVVRDTGSGIDPDDLPYVFERFSRQDSARNREHGGVGLGLAIAKAIIEAHGGTIAIASTPHEGTRVSLRLPAQAV